VPSAQGEFLHGRMVIEKKELHFYCKDLTAVFDRILMSSQSSGPERVLGHLARRQQVSLAVEKEAGRRRRQPASSRNVLKELPVAF